MKKTASFFPEHSGIFPNNEKSAARVTMESIIANGVLSLFKLLSGIFAHSGAMISDAVHSASDVISSIIVIIGIKMAAKESDTGHPYGHERFECVAAIILCAILLVSGLFIGYSAILNIAGGETEIPMPGMPALAAAIISIIVKEGMFRYAARHAKRLNSGALMADAWHHRSDALSSVGALIGIAGAQMGFFILEPIASIVICAFILKASLDIFRDAISKMVDSSCGAEKENAISGLVLTLEGVVSVSSIRTRMFGNRIYADIEICADGGITLSESHAIALNVHDSIEKAFPEIKHISVRVKPLEGAEEGENRE